MKWFRFYSEALNDPKVQRLAPPLFKHWVNLLCVANNSTPRGILPNVADIAYALRITEPQVRKVLAELQAAGLLDTLPDGTLAPHNWVERQRNSDDVAARVRRYRNGGSEDPAPAKKRVDMLPVTLPSTEHVTLQVTGPQQECIALDRDIDIDQTRRDRERVNHIPADAHASAHAPGTAITKQARLPPRIPDTPLPKPYPLTEEMRVWVQQETPSIGADVDRQHSLFCAHYWADANAKRTNWRPMWEAWMWRTVKEFAPKAPPGSVPTGPPRRYLNGGSPDAVA